MSNLYVQETYIDKDQNCICGESDVYETFTNNIGELFKNYQKEYGACISKMYQDNKNGSSIHIGWVFQKRVNYSDCNDSYISETWVSIHKKPPTKIIKYHYAKLKN